jgi:predicted  nucleic acid-binding Zn-ribbon protein
MNKTIAKLQERIEELVSENEAWKKEAKRWRDMYIEYDEMLEKDLEKAKTRIANVTSKIKSLEKEMNDEKY